MPTGVVKRYIAEDGYGFISNGDSGDEDIFFHIYDVEEWNLGPEPEEGDKASFKVEASDRGLRATDVRSLDS